MFVFVEQKLFVLFAQANKTKRNQVCVKYIGKNIIKWTAINLDYFILILAVQKPQVCTIGHWSTVELALDNLPLTMDRRFDAQYYPGWQSPHHPVQKKSVVFADLTSPLAELAVAVLATAKNNSTISFNTLNIKFTHEDTFTHLSVVKTLCTDLHWVLDQAIDQVWVDIQFDGSCHSLVGKSAQFRC